jgi:hypothetical protein
MVVLVAFLRRRRPTSAAPSAQTAATPTHRHLDRGIATPDTQEPGKRYETLIPPRNIGKPD